MAATLATVPPPYPPFRTVPHAAPAIVPATDLGGVCVLKHGRQFLLADAAGNVRPDARGLGLYDGDTRFLSSLVLRIDGQPPVVMRADPGGASAGTIALTNPDPPRRRRGATAPGGTLARRSLAITRRRRLDAGLHEQLTVTNVAGRPETIVVELLVDVDMADIFEVRGYTRPRRGELGRIELGAGQARFPYFGLDGMDRWTTLSAPGARLRTVRHGGAAVAARWERAVQAGETVTLAWSVRFETFAAATPPGGARVNGDQVPAGPLAVPPAARVESTTVRSDHEPFDRVIGRGVADLALLVTPGPGPGQRLLAAGVPWFTTLFGRDAILASFAALVVDPSLAVDTLRVLGGLQATDDDPARDAEVGKIPHEIRDGEMARNGEVPFGRYYGAADTTPLWLVLLGETFDWTGDLDLVRELWPNALAALDWLERGGDPDGDGFIEYHRRAHGGLVNQGWKDALDAVQDRAGHVAEGPIALVEVQGYAYDARIRMARLARAIGDVPLAERLEADAARLRARFASAYWVPDLATCALALDGAKRPMDAIGSNQGHALWSGIVDERHAPGVAERLAGPGLDSGWGVRTFAAGQPGYTPFGYHTGTVWPHDVAIAIAGLRRYGFDAAAGRLADGLLEAALRFPDARLPEQRADDDRGLQPGQLARRRLAVPGRGRIRDHGGPAGGVPGPPAVLRARHRGRIRERVTIDPAPPVAPRAAPCQHRMALARQAPSRRAGRPRHTWGVHSIDPSRA